MNAMPQIKELRSAELKRGPSPQGTLQSPAEFAADAPRAERKIRTTVYDDVFAVVSLGCLVIGGAFAFYVLFGMQ